MREVPGDGAEAECTLKRAKEVSCASGEEGPDDERREETRKERNWWKVVAELVLCVKRSLVVAVVPGNVRGQNSHHAKKSGC